MSTVIDHSPLESINADRLPPEAATGIHVTIHGHFYQPPRENPYINTIERQPAAAPFQNWNERIHYECYRPNAFARIFNNDGEVLGIINNFEYMSFNIGPTLMSWMQEYDREVYERILEADRKSCERLNGHGNAIAQAYNHIILPLANKRDKYTQIRWGKADFRSRFGRDPEGMWLPETAVDYATLAALVDEGLKFIILAPSQAERCREIPTEQNPDPIWHSVGGGQIDPTRPYRCYLPDGRHLDIFFYDGPISRDMGFSDVLSSSDLFIGRLGLAVRGDHRKSQLISVATDGETFGHHKMGTEKCLAYAFAVEFPERGWSVTNFAHYLSICPPTWEVVLKPVTAWSCSHGVDRWQDDCGCGGGGTYHQKWRRPLRDALDWLRDQLEPLFEEAGDRLFHDPWQARDEYIDVILERSASTVKEFLTRYQHHPLSPAEEIDALRLLEMQRHALLMYTSCGWFFEELSRPEGTQILRYAARAIELAGEIGGVQLERPFIDLLAKAPSNLAEFRDGAGVYRRQVVTSQVTFEQMTAHYGISSLFHDYAEQHRLYCFGVHQLDYQRQRMGSLTLAVGQVRLTSEITWESKHLVFAVLHLGGWDFHCCIQPFAGRREYGEIKEELFSSLNQASAAQTILDMTRLFSENRYYGLKHLFPEERYSIMQQLTANTRQRLDQLYTQVYRDNYGVLLAFHQDEREVPQELQVAAEVALSNRGTIACKSLQQATNAQDFERCLSELDAISTEAHNLHCRLKIPGIQQTLEKFTLRALNQLLANEASETLEEEVTLLLKALTVGESLRLNIDLSRVQEIYYTCLYQEIVPMCLEPETQPKNITVDPACRWRPGQMRSLLKLGQKLGIDVNAWLAP
ncbi:MAG: DUF3536 domain-containing protein [Cyanobacteria bacterium P01_H01_bin.15]